MRAPRRLDPDRVVEHLPRLYRVARAWCRSREEAEDLVQETCARVLARPRLLRGEDELGYLLRALRNTLVSLRRTESRRPITAALVEDLATSLRSTEDPAEAAEINEVYSAIATLPDEFRDAIVAVDVAGLSYGEASRLLSVPEGRSRAACSALVTESLAGSKVRPPAPRRETKRGCFGASAWIVARRLVAA
jgi:RNA polymerase sigma-70 factor, ECF subfamily